MQMEAEARGGWEHESPAWRQEEGAKGGLGARKLRESQLAGGTHREPGRVEYRGGVSGESGEVWGWEKGEGTSGQKGAA
jgi:hypothetical protein